MFGNVFKYIVVLFDLFRRGFFTVVFFDVILDCMLVEIIGLLDNGCVVIHYFFRVVDVEFGHGRSSKGSSLDEL